MHKSVIEHVGKLATSVRASMVSAALQRFRMETCRYSEKEIHAAIRQATTISARHERELLRLAQDLDAAACQRELSALLSVKAKLQALQEELTRRNSLQPALFS